MAQNEFKEKYLGTYLGLLWAILRPLTFVLVIWAVFTLGLKINKIEDDAPFILFLLCGYAPWSFFSEALNSGMSAITGNKFLVKRVSFDSNILPLVRIVSALFLHLVFILILVFALITYGFTPSKYWLQFPFYLLNLVILLAGVCWIVSSLRVFTADIAQIVGIALQIGFWVTPIFWSLNQIPPQYEFLSFLNPLVFIVEGYRNTFLNEVWFWEDTRLFWPFLFYVFAFTLGGRIVFSRLKPHFWDVL